MNGETFIGRMLQVVPDLKSVYDQHLIDNDSLLPHVFMGDVTRFVITEADRPVKHEELKKLFYYFEEGLSSGDMDTKELIIASFVENLIGETEAVKKLAPLMGLNLRREVKQTVGC